MIEPEEVLRASEAREPSKIETQLQYLAQNLDYLQENTHRLRRMNAKLNGEKVEKTQDGNPPVREPDGLLSTLLLLNEKFEGVNSVMSGEINELNETI